MPATPSPVNDSRTKGEEVAVAVLSDWQLAKVTPDYNSLICEERINKYADKVVSLTEIQRADHPVKDNHVWVLGDIVEGELIFPGQSFLIDGVSVDQSVSVELGNLTWSGLQLGGDTDAYGAIVVT